MCDGDSASSVHRRVFAPASHCASVIASCCSRPPSVCLAPSSSSRMCLIVDSSVPPSVMRTCTQGRCGAVQVEPRRHSSCASNYNFPRGEPPQLRRDRPSSAVVAASASVVFDCLRPSSAWVSAQSSMGCGSLRWTSVPCGSVDATRCGAVNAVRPDVMPSDAVRSIYRGSVRCGSLRRLFEWCWHLLTVLRALGSASETGICLEVFGRACSSTYVLNQLGVI